MIKSMVVKAFSFDRKIKLSSHPKSNPDIDPLGGFWCHEVLVILE